jgi:hypothetical protein
MVVPVGHDSGWGILREAGGMESALMLSTILPHCADHGVHLVLKGAGKIQ